MLRDAVWGSKQTSLPCLSLHSHVCAPVSSRNTQTLQRITVLMLQQPRLPHESFLVDGVVHVMKP